MYPGTFNSFESGEGTGAIAPQDVAHAHAGKPPKASWFAKGRFAHDR